MNKVFFLVFASLVLSSCSPQKSTQSRVIGQAPAEPNTPSNPPGESAPQKPSPSEPTEPSPVPPPNDPVPTPTPTPPELSRIYTRMVCNSSSIEVNFLLTLTSKASEAFIPKTLQIKTPLVKNHKILNYLLIQSTPEFGDFFISTQEPNSSPYSPRPHQIYRAQVAFIEGSSQLSPVGSIGSEATTLLDLIRNFDPQATSIGLSREGAFVLFPNAETNTYEIRDLKTLSVLKSLPVSSKTYTNPKISPDGEWVLFQSWDTNNVVRLSFFSLSTNRLTALSNLSKDHHQIGAIWANENILAWKEYDWKERKETLRLAKIISTQGPQLVTLPSSAVSSFTAYADSDEEFKIAFTEESWESPTEPNLPWTLLEGSLHLWTFDSQTLNQTHAEEVPYPSQLLRRYIIKGRSAINSLTPAPWSNELYGSLTPWPGMVSFSMTDKSWRLHATQGAESCAHFQISPEVKINEIPFFDRSM